MAYTDTSDLFDAAGGETKFIELADLDGDGSADSAVVTRAQARADGWINFHVRRQNSALIPFGAGVLANVDPNIRAIAAEETVYRLKRARGLAVQADHDEHEARADELTALAKGEAVTSNDPHPVGSATTPAVVETTTTSDSTTASDFTTWGAM